MCSLEFPDVEQIWQRQADLGFMALGVATGGPGGGETQESVEAFLEQTQVTFPIVWDDDSMEQFAWPDSISPFPRQAVVDKQGKVVYLASEHDPDSLEAAIVEALAR